MSQAKAFAAFDNSSPLRPFTFERREPLARDVQFDVLFCGVCHSDLHTAKSEWPGTVYPCVPGHEIVGRVTRVGASVKKFKAGDAVAVGCLVDSCRTCGSCKEGLEQYCQGGPDWPRIHPEEREHGGRRQRRLLDELRDGNRGSERERTQRVRDGDAPA